MKIYELEKERGAIGETNSSSCHSFTTSNQSADTDLIELITNHVNEFNNNIAPFVDYETEFGWQEDEYSKPQQIWNYIIAGIHNNSNEVSKFISIIERETGLSNLELISEKDLKTHTDNFWVFGYVDHESSYIAFQLLKQLDENFNILNTTEIETDNDNH